MRGHPVGHRKLNKQSPLVRGLHFLLDALASEAEHPALAHLAFYPPLAVQSRTEQLVLVGDGHPHNDHAAVLADLSVHHPLLC